MIETPTLTRTREPKKIRFRKALLSPDQIQAKLCRRSLFYFIQTFWHEVSSDAPKWNWHIPYLAGELMQLAYRVAENKPKDHDLIINIPPGTTKSITASIMYPVWCWTNWHWMRFITASYSGALSLEHAEHSRDLVRSDTFRALFPELEIKQDKDTKSNFRVQKRVPCPNGRCYIELGGNRYSTSAGGTLTGFHGHQIIVDDPLDPNRAASPVELKSCNDWMDGTLSTRKVDKAVTPIVLIQQRLHQDDPTGHILAKGKGNTRHISLPGEIRSYRDSLMPAELASHYEDDLLDPERMDWSVLKELQADLGQYGFAGQIGQKPTPPGGGMFKIDHFQIVEHISVTQSIVRYWDKAGTADGGAFTVGVKMAKLKDGRFIVMDVKRGQWDSDKREQIILETAKADGTGVHIFIEQEPGSGGKESAQSTIRNLAGFVCKADRPTGDKVYRADPYSVQVNSGNVSLARSEWNKVFIEEHGFFPFSAFKDQVDAASGSFSKLIAKRVARVIR